MDDDAFFSVAFGSGDAPVLRSGVNGLAILLLIGTIVLGVAWLGRQIQRAALRQSLNGPKYLLLAAAIPMHWIALLTPMPNKPIALVAILTIYHNLQYHRLIWFHNQKYSARRADVSSNDDRLEPGLVPAGGTSATSKRSDATRQFGPAAFISRWTRQRATFSSERFKAIHIRR